MTYFLKTMEYKKDQVVFKKGDPSLGIFIVLNGEFELRKEFNIKKAAH